MSSRSLHRTTLALAMGAALLMVLAACAPIPKLADPAASVFTALNEQRQRSNRGHRSNGQLPYDLE